MAAAPCLHALREEAMCPVCWNHFSSPQTIRCGHSFCRSCLQQLWDEDTEAVTCPVCRQPSHKGDLRTNRLLAALVTIVQQYEDEPVGDCPEPSSPPPEEAVQEAVLGYKEKLQYQLDCMKKGLEKKWKTLREEKEPQVVKRNLQRQRERISSEFEEMHRLLYEEEKAFLLRLDEKQKEILLQLEGYITQTTEQYEKLGRLIEELQEESSQPPMEYLKVVTSSFKRCESGKIQKEVMVPPDLGSFLTIPSQCHVSPHSLVKAYQVSVSLDPKTAHPELILSEDLKTVRWGDVPQDLPRNPERFSVCCRVLGAEGFTCGRQYWEAEVGYCREWVLGVARESVRRTGGNIFTPLNGTWSLCKRNGQIRTQTVPEKILPMRRILRRLGIYLDCDWGEVSFYDAETSVLIYAFHANFTEKMFPYVWNCDRSVPITLCP